MFKKSFSAFGPQHPAAHNKLVLTKKQSIQYIRLVDTPQYSQVSKEARPLFEICQANKFSVIEVCTLPGKS